MRILLLNWRCPRNPRAGGAERLTYEIAKRLVARGDQVEWFAAGYAGAVAQEELDGIQIVRGGRQATVHVHAVQRYWARHETNFDCVIDEVNTIPFFTPVWARIPTFMLIFQLAREVWWYESPFPLGALGYVIEPGYLRFYRKTPVLTISTSTERDLRAMGFSASISQVPIGVSVSPSLPTQKQHEPTFVYAGRITPSKRIEHLIEAIGIFRQWTRCGKLWLIGQGSEPYSDKLNAIVRARGLAGHVDFLGQLTEEEKHCRMAAAHALLMASVREGWGLVVTEANAVGTPAIVYDVGGLRDAVKDRQTGLIVPPRPADMAEAMRRVYFDAQFGDRLARQAKRWSSEFSLERSATVFRDSVISGVECVP